MIYETLHILNVSLFCLYLSFTPRHCWRMLVRYFVERLSLGLSKAKVFSRFNWVYGILEEYQRHDVPFSGQFTRGIWPQYVLLLLILTLSTWLRWYLPRFSTIKTLFSPMQLINMWGEILWGYVHILLCLTL